MSELKLLELCCGTKSVTNVFLEHGANCRTLDYDKRFNPTYCCDILDWDITELNGWVPNVIWFSPPCTHFSVANIGRCWIGGKNEYIPANNEVVKSLLIVLKGLEIIDKLKPQYWFIENPRGVLRKLDFMQTFNQYRHLVTYCQYGENYMKPTDIWSNNLFWISKPPCKNNSPCHESAPRGSKKGIQGINGRDRNIKRGIIPRALCEEIYLSCYNNL